MMRRILRILLLGAALACAGACGTSGSGAAGGGEGGALVSGEVFITGLSTPVAMAIAGDGTILITQQSGAVRVVRAGVLDPVTVVTVAPQLNYEAGLLGIALAPDFLATGDFYIVYTPAADTSVIHIAKARLLSVGGSMVQDPVFTIAIPPATAQHFGGNIHFDPTGTYLFMSVGDLGVTANAQDPDTPNGGLLRYFPDGSIPPDNPISGTSAVYAYGMRNSFDFIFDSGGRIWASENGPTENDEINLITPGANYGWPVVNGVCDDFPALEPCIGPNPYTDPLWEFREVIAATGVVRYAGALFPDLVGDLLVGGWRSGAVHRLVMVGTTPVQEQTLFRPLNDGAVVDVEVGPDDAIYVLTRTQGRIYRLAP